MLSPPIYAVTGNANGHGQAHGPGEVSKQYHVCAGVGCTANDYDTPKQDGVHDELEGIFVLSPMDEGRYTAAKHQAGKEHQEGRQSEKIGVGVSIAAATATCDILSVILELGGLACALAVQLQAG